MLKDNLKSLRETKGLTKKQVAQGVGINERAYIAYEYGERDVSTDTLCKLAKFYGVTTDYLLGLEPPPPPTDAMEVLGIEKSVDDDEFMKLYNELPDYAKQIFVDTMAKLAQATTSNLKKQSTRPPSTPKPVEPSAKPDIQISQMRNSEFAIARGGMYKPVPTDEQIASFTPVPEDSGL